MTVFFIQYLVMTFVHHRLDPRDPTASRINSHFYV